MEIAWHSNLMQRTYTAPVASASAAFATPQTGKRPAHMSTGAHSSTAAQLMNSQGHTSSNYSIQSQQSSRNSDTTQGTTNSTLFSSTASTVVGNAGAVAVQNGTTPAVHDVQPTDNIMNTVANASSSLFHIFVALRQRLEAVPGFGEMVLEEEARIGTEVPHDHDGYKDIRDAFPGYETREDPIILLWRTFRRGIPLALIYNTLRPEEPLQVTQYSNWIKQGKATTFRFIQACIENLGFHPDHCFLTSDLYNSDTSGFLKVARVINRLLDLLVQQNLIEDIQPTLADFQQAEKGAKRTQRQHIVAELVTTERTYVQHLELLNEFRNLVMDNQIVGRETAIDIFHNLNALIDHQRRFLIRVEQINLQPEAKQNWGRLFIEFKNGFRVYDDYIANQEKSERTIVSEFPRLIEAGGSPEMRQMVGNGPGTLHAFLMKPFQRLSKYPLLLGDLYKKGDLSDEMKVELTEGREVAVNCLNRANAAVDRLTRIKAVEELKTRVEDWKGHKVEQFGELLLYGSFTVIKSENSGPGKDGERQYHVYLFHAILLCCKDIDLSKPKNKLSNKQLVDKRGKPKLQLKGRIFMQNVTDLVSLAKPGSYTCQIFWRGDPSIENFIIRFQSEQMMRTWTHQIDALRRGHGRARNSAASSRYGTSATEFEFMRNQPAIENPYARPEEEDEDDVDTLVTASRYSTQAGDLARSRNSSQTSLRSRSMTGDSGNGPPVMGASGGRVPPPRMPSGSLQAQPQLSLRTRELSGTQSPGGQPFAGDSYFSPTMDSPMSSVRTSTSSANVYPFPRPQMAQNGYYEEGHGHTRFTAPAMARQRQPSGTPDPYAPATRIPSGPAALHSAQQNPVSAGARSRSASSPNIHNAIRGAGNGAVPMRMQPGVITADQPPVPDVPAPYQQQQMQMQFGTIPRSQSNSPSLANGPGISRGQSYSPQTQRGPAYPPPPTSSSQLPQQSYSRPPTMGMTPGAAAAAAAVAGLAQQSSSQQSPDASPIDYTTRNNTTTPVTSAAAAGNASHSLSPSVSYNNNDPSVASPVSTTSTAPVPITHQGPTQLKVKVHCPSAAQTLTLVVPLNISYASLRDRIDAKLQRSTNLCLVDRASVQQQNGTATATVVAGEKSQVKLKYLDEKDLVSMQSDEDVLTAFETWAEQRGEDVMGMGEIELYCSP